MIKRHYILLISIFLVSISKIYAQPAAGDSINQTDAQGWKQGRWVTVSDESSPQACKAGQRIEVGMYKDNRKTGTWRKYWCSGKIKNELVYQPDRTVLSKDFYENGNLKEQGTWNSQGWIGEYKFFYENGKAFYEWVYDESGKRTGKQKYYYENGNTMFDGEWNAGNEAGVIKEYYEDGSLKSEKNFNNGKLDSLSVKVYPQKAKPVEKKEEVKKDEPPPPPPVKEDLGLLSDGFHRTFNKEKLVEKEGTFSNGKFIDGKIYYYKEGKLFKTVMYKEGKVEKTILESDKKDK